MPFTKQYHSANKTDECAISRAYTRLSLAQPQPLNKKSFSSYVYYVYQIKEETHKIKFDSHCNRESHPLAPGGKNGDNRCDKRRCRTKYVAVSRGQSVFRSQRDKKGTNNQAYHRESDEPNEQYR